MRTGSVQESLGLDRVDAQIVRCLQLNPRAPFSLLATTLDTSEQTVARRYRRMRSQGLLRITGVVAPRALGLHDWVLRLRCRPDRATALADAMVRREDVSWLGITAGGSEIICSLRSRSQRDSDELLLDLLPRTTPAPEISAAVLLNRFAGGDPSDWSGFEPMLTPEQTAAVTAPVPPAPTGTGTVTLSPSDHVLLDLLAQDGRTTVAALARATGLTEARAGRRVQTLVDSGVVYFDLDLAEDAIRESAGSAYLWLTVEPAHLDAVGHALAELPNVYFAAAITGPTNLVASVGSPSLDGLYRFLTDSVGQLPGVRAADVSPVARWVKGAGALMRGSRLAEPTPSRRTVRSRT